MTAVPRVTRMNWRDTARLVASRFPTVGVFDRIASPEDLQAVLELESWTNDRVNAEIGLLHAVAPQEWVTGRPMASVVMAAYCHPNPSGTRFAGLERGVWYSARRLETAIAESLYHRGRELREIGVSDARLEMRLYRADFRTTFHDLRGSRSFERVLDPDTYVASQALAQRLLESGSHGIVYPSVRHAGGECVACFRPALVLNVRAVAHYELRWEAGIPRASRLQRFADRIPDSGRPGVS
jgi:RES domain